MRRNATLFSLTLFVSVLIHFYVLTKTKVETVESYKGQVVKITKIKSSIFPMSNVEFMLSNANKKSARIPDLLLNEFKLGKNYKIKSHKNWVLAAELTKV